MEFSAVTLTFTFKVLVVKVYVHKKVSEYDQGIPQSLTADKPVASCGRDTRRQTKQSNQLSLPHQDDCKTRMDTK